MKKYEVEFVYVGGHHIINLDENDTLSSALALMRISDREVDNIQYIDQDGRELCPTMPIRDYDCAAGNVIYITPRPGVGGGFPLEVASILVSLAGVLLPVLLQYKESRSKDAEKKLQAFIITHEEEIRKEIKRLNSFYNSINKDKRREKLFNAIRIYFNVYHNIASDDWPISAEKSIFVLIREEVETE